MSRRAAERGSSRPTDGGYEVTPALRRYIRFEGQNLAAPVFQGAPGSLDLILCRNVIIYFDLPTIRGLMDRFLAALRPGGLLLLGYSESLFKVYDRFEMVEVEARSSTGGRGPSRRSRLPPVPRRRRPPPPRRLGGRVKSRRSLPCRHRLPRRRPF